MSRNCTICAHSQRPEINAALISNEPIRKIAARLAISPSALQRHKATHLPATLVKAVAAAEEVEASTLLERLTTLHRETVEILKEARADGSKALALQAIARAEKQLELEGRLLGELNDAPSVNIVMSPEWIAIRTAIYWALQPYPDAWRAVAGALKNAGA